MRRAAVPPSPAALSTAACVAAVLAVASWGVVQADSLPFDRSNPLIWDNDSEADVYSLAFGLALANNGDVRLIGISQSPNPFKKTSEDYQSLVKAARASGWRNAPDATSNLGSRFMTALTRPSSSRSTDTVPLDTAPARMIRDRVLATGTASKPVVIGTGGALTTVASSYLLALRQGRGEEFAHKSVVAASIGVAGLTPVGLEYNASQDEWAMYVVLDRLRVVLAPLNEGLTLEDQRRLWDYIDALPDTAVARILRRVKATWPYRYELRLVVDSFLETFQAAFRSRSR